MSRGAAPRRLIEVLALFEESKRLSAASPLSLVLAA